MVNHSASSSEIITSFKNPLVKRIRRLNQKKYRQEEGAFFVEGLRAVLSAIESGINVETLVHCPGLLRSEIGRQAIAAQAAQGVTVAALSEEVFSRISSRENPVGLGAILPTNWSNYEAWVVNQNDIFVALHRVSEPGNLGTVCRTIDAVNGAGLLLVDHSADPFHPRAVKASMGAIFSTQIAFVPNLELLLKWARANKLLIVASSARASHSFWEVDYTLPSLLLAGSEGTGLPQEALEDADLSVRIPMEGSSTSLNLAVAVGLILYELRRKQAVQ